MTKDWFRKKGIISLRWNKIWVYKIKLDHLELRPWVLIGMLFLKLASVCNMPSQIIIWTSLKLTTWIKFRNWIEEIMRIPNSKFSHSRASFRMINYHDLNSRLHYQSMQVMVIWSVTSPMLLLLILNAMTLKIRMNS